MTRDTLSLSDMSLRDELAEAVKDADFSPDKPDSLAGSRLFIADACLGVMARRIDRVVECMEESKSPFQNHSSETHRRAMQQAIEIVQHAFPKPPTTKA